MRRVFFLVILGVAAACGSSSSSDTPSTVVDAGTDSAIPDAATNDTGVADSGADVVTDANLDAPDGDAATCTSKVLLLGGTDVTTQGWTIVMEAPATLTNGADYVRLETTTNGGAVASGQLLLTYANAVDVGKPFKLEIDAMVESVDMHNTLDSAAAIMGSFTPPVGTSTERSQMIYLDSAQIGWADDTQSYPVNVADGNYHTYVFSVDAASTAHFTIDGVAALARAGFTTNGTIAIGDQTNDANIDSAIQIRSITKLCP